MRIVGARLAGMTEATPSHAVLCPAVHILKTDPTFGEKPELKEALDAGLPLEYAQVRGSGSGSITRTPFVGYT